jgi:hypothetical protein
MSAQVRFDLLTAPLRHQLNPGTDPVEPPHPGLFDGREPDAAMLLDQVKIATLVQASDEIYRQEPVEPDTVTAEEELPKNALP